MKKYLSILLIALMMLAVLFISVSCNQGEVVEDDPTKCTVTFNTQGGSEIAPVSVTIGNKVARPANDPVKAGYVFSGWYKDSACKTIYNFSSAVKKPITIYAKWIDETTLGKIVLNFNYTSKKPETVYATLGTTAVITTPKRSGYVFMGWYEDADCTESKKFDTSTVINKNYNLYAKWVTLTEYEHSNPILPTGTGQTIPTDWSVNPRGMIGLPEIKYNFSGTVTSETNVTAELIAGIETAMNTPGYFDDTPTKILFLFSDGWGVSSVDMSREYKGELIMDSLPYYTQSRTDCYVKYSHDGSNTDYTKSTTTDSPAGGTQVLAGYKTRYGYISLDVDANIVPNLSDVAFEKGWKIACVTNDNIVDATPACAIIHDTNRYHSDVLYYKALLVANNWDLLMGWDWGTGTYFGSGKWADKLLDAAKEGIKDANEREKTGSLPSGQTPIQFFKQLSDGNKAKVAPFLIYYTLWELLDESRLNSWQRWTRSDAGKAEMNEFLAWLDDPTGLATVIAQLDAYGDPASYISKYSNFAAVLKNTDFSKPILGSWTKDGAKYDEPNPNRGYALHGEIAEAYPSWPEMVAYTIYQLDKEAGVDGGFFAMIENTCTDGWGHAEIEDNAVKAAHQMNEVQCLDEGIAIAVKYVLEHPDTLLVISADHETGGFTFQKPKNGTGDEWKSDISMIISTTTGHSSQNVPLYAFGAGAENFSAAKIQERFGSQANAQVEDNGNVHEGWITGALLGWLITGEPFGEPAEYNGQPVSYED